MSRRPRQLAFLVLSLVALAALALRLSGIGEASLWIDEGYTLNGALATLERGLPILDSGALYPNGLLSSYVVAASVALFGFDPFDPAAARAPFALFGTGLVYAAYALYRRYFGDRGGALLAAAIIAFSYWEIAWSRQVRGYTAASLFLVLAVISFKRFLDEKTHRYRYLAGTILSTAIAALFQGAALGALAGFVAVLVYERAVRSRASRALLWAAALSVPVSLLVLGALWGPMPSGALPHYARVADKDLVVAFLGSAALLFLAIAPRDGIRSAGRLPVFAFASLAGVAVCAGALQIRYAFPYFPVLAVSTIYAASLLSERLLGVLSRNVRIALSLALSLALFAPSLSVAPRSSYGLERGSPQPDFESAFSRIWQEKEEGDIVISGYTQLHKVYLGEPGMWLKMSLNNGPSGADKKIVDGVDYYAGAPVVESVEALAEIVEKDHGFILVDPMTRSRIPGLFVYLEGEERVSRIGEYKSRTGGQVHLYRF